MDYIVTTSCHIYRIYIYVITVCIMFDFPSFAKPVPDYCLDFCPFSHNASISSRHFCFLSRNRDWYDLGYIAIIVSKLHKYM